MSELPVTIPDHPALQPAEDFYRLRREGIGYIEQMASRLWTDFNLHDPGITILEALCYAITDLAYRSGWQMQDLLASPNPPADPGHPYPDQSFFSAREILTVNPVTPLDLRRLLIDLDLVRNAWVICKECPCEGSYYAFCEDDALKLSWLPSTKPETVSQAVWPAGLYEALLELEIDPHLGDLNDRKVEFSSVTRAGDGSHTTLMELRFPEVSLADRAGWALFLESDDAFAGRSGASFTLNLTRFGATKDYDVFSDPLLDEEGRNQYLRSHWRDVFYASFAIELHPSGETIVMENAGLRLFGDSSAKSAATVAAIKAILESAGGDGFLLRYRDKVKRRIAAVASAKEALCARRNLCEDYCRVRSVGIEEVAVCAEVDVAPDADIELVQARIWFEIEQYLNPPVPFYSLKEMLDAGTGVEEIFNGPALENGFLREGDLAAASLKSVLRVSDIINRVMDIEGVVAVKQLQLAKYDSEGQVVKGSADPSWSGDGNPVFDRDKSSASWLMYLTPQHQPRLYQNASSFLFTKNGLPFRPRLDEALDTLTQLRGEAERPKLKNAQKDLPVPVGSYRTLQDYFPLQYSLPQSYGIGPAGLPSFVPARRRAQAKQLKGYLMVFEQLLGNALAQLGHLKDLFSLDTAVSRTYFALPFTEQTIAGYDQLTSGLAAAALQKMLESEPEFLERRNRFLDHLMARFGEQFKEYALLLTNLEGEQVALDRLIRDKVSFLGAYPLVSHDRARGADYRRAPCTRGNEPGLKTRLSLLLGYPDLSFSWKVVTPGSGVGYQESYQLKDRMGRVWLAMAPIAALEPVLHPFLATLSPKDGETFHLSYRPGAFQVQVDQGNAAPPREFQLSATANAETAALRDTLEQAFRAALLRMVQVDAFKTTPEGGKVRLQLQDEAGAVLGEEPQLFPDQAAAAAARDELAAWSANERAIVVEHLLLRPKFTGDALYPACSEGGCATCGDEDPYSFRVTFVMPGWTAPFNTNLQMRGFAERTIREETPAHLLPKICWVGNDGFIEKEHEPAICALTALLLAQGADAGGGAPAEADASNCAVAIFAAFNAAFRHWYEDKVLEHVAADVLRAALETQFGAIDPTTLPCALALPGALWDEIKAELVAHFLEIAANGWQFERFENAWCRWQQANAAFDWTEEFLQERVQAILAEHALAAPQQEELCSCAAAIVTAFGETFRGWISAGVSGGGCQALGPLPPVAIDLSAACAGMAFREGTAEKLSALLTDRYGAYAEVSCRLALVVKLLSELKNTYPPATLHDFDEGSDQNPVRLGQTSLGS